MEPWMKVVRPRPEVLAGRSFNPDEFAIALEQVVDGTAPLDYRDPREFFARTCWTSMLRGIAAEVLRRLAGETQSAAPVISLITQFGGGKTHALTTLYHLAKAGDDARYYPGVNEVLKEAGLPRLPQARVGVFVGNAWDPQPGKETPWIDLARQIAGDRGVEELGPGAGTSAPGTEALRRVFLAANAPVLLLLDEVLNFLSRHREMADQFYAFIMNLTVAAKGFPRCAAVISLPRSQVEMTEWDSQWQEKIAKVVHRVANQLIANDESEISEVVRRRLFDDLGSDRVRRKVAQEFAEWCFARRALLPPEWTAVDTSTSDAKARDYLRSRFERSYPFHPATLSVFQRKWQSLPQYQQTRGTLAMLAQWVAWAYREGQHAVRREPLITLGSAPLHDPRFRSSVLGQLGEPRLEAAILSDIAGEQSHARALDAGTKDQLRDIHRRVGAAILFESSGGQIDKVAYLPELRFALLEPGIETTSIDTAANALAARAYYIRKVGSDGFKIGYKPTISRAVSDRRASLDEESDVKPKVRELVLQEFRSKADVPVVAFPAESTDVPDSPKLTIVLVDPDDEWTGNGEIRQRLATWTVRKGSSPRLRRGMLVWCVKKPGKELRNRVAEWLAWERVAQDVANGTLGGDYEQAELAEIRSRLESARDDAREEVWASYRYVVVADQKSPDGLHEIDLGAGHSSSGTTLTGRVLQALRSEGLLNESVGANYINSHWPPAFKDSGAWPLASLLQSFVDGTLTRLPDPEAVLRRRIAEFVESGEFGLAAGQRSDGSYERVWFREPVDPLDVTFDRDVYLLRRSTAEALVAGASSVAPPPSPIREETDDTLAESGERPLLVLREPAAAPVEQPPASPDEPCTLRWRGEIPMESWNSFGYRVIPKLREQAQQGQRVRVRVDVTVETTRTRAESLRAELRDATASLGITGEPEIDEAGGEVPSPGA